MCIMVLIALLEYKSLKKELSFSNILTFVWSSLLLVKPSGFFSSAQLRSRGQKQRGTCLSLSKCSGDGVSPRTAQSECSIETVGLRKCLGFLRCFVPSGGL